MLSFGALFLLRWVWLSLQGQLPRFEVRVANGASTKRNIIAARPATRAWLPITLSTLISSVSLPQRSGQETPQWHRFSGLVFSFVRVAWFLHCATHVYNRKAIALSIAPVVPSSLIVSLGFVS